MNTFEKWKLEYRLDASRNTLKWLEWAAEDRKRPEGAPPPVVGSIGTMTVLGNVIEVNINLSPEIMKMILDYNRQRLLNNINQIETALKENKK